MPAETLVRRGDIIVPGEERLWFLFDTVTVNNAGTQTEFFFFRDGPAGKTRAQTNMRLAGQIPAGHVFRIASIMFRPALGTSLTAGVVPLSIANFLALMAAKLELEVGNVIKFETPARKCPAGGGYAGGISVSSNALINVAAAQNGIPSPAMALLIKPKVVVTANENFLVRLRYVTAPVVSVNIPVIVTLGGKLERPFQ